MSRSSSTWLRLTNTKRFYFWLALPVTLLVIAAYVGVQVLVIHFQRSHPVHVVQLLPAIVFQFVSLIYLFSLLYKLWQGKRDRAALILFAVLGACLFTVVIPIDLVVLLVLYLTLKSKQSKRKA